ncbi:MAG: Mbeg1-like protein [Lachnospiraceae bacterium]
MSFMVVPAQEEAARYVADIAARTEGPLELTGHSKGGNLSVYAASFAGEQAQQRLRAAYSFDGPGMYQPQLYAEGYQAVKDRIHSYIPQSSVVGMLMYYHPVYTVVESDAVGILQHDAMTWQVRGGHFVCLEGLDMTGRITDEALHSWMAGLDSEARKTFVEVLYTVLEAARIELVTDFTDDWRDRALKMLEALRAEIDPDTRRKASRPTLQALTYRRRPESPAGAAPDEPNEALAWWKSSAIWAKARIPCSWCGPRWCFYLRFAPTGRKCWTRAAAWTAAPGWKILRTQPVGWIGFAA